MAAAEAAAKARNAGSLSPWQGRENAKEYLRQNTELSNEIELAIRQQSLSGEIPLVLSGGEEEDLGDD